MKQEPILEFLRKKNKGSKNSNTINLKNNWVIESKDIKKYEKLFESIVDFMKKTVRTTIPNCELSDDKIEFKIVEYDNATKYSCSVDIVNFNKNWENIKKSKLIKDINNTNSISDVEGEEICRFIESKILSKLTGKGFTKNEDTYCYYSYGKEDYSSNDYNGYGEFSVRTDSGYKDLYAFINFVVPKNNVIEESFVTGEPILEFLKRKKKEKTNWNPDEDDKVIDMKDVNKYKSLFTNSIKATEDIVKKVVNDIKLDTDDIEIKETDMGGYTKLYMFKDIVSFPNNYSLLKSKYPKVFNSEEYDDVDGSKLHKWLVDNILKKTQTKGFAEYRYTDLIYNYTKENQNDTFLGIVISDDYERLSISMTIYYKKDNVIKEAVNITGEPLLELFKRRQKDVEKHHNDKKPLPEKLRKKEKKEYDVKQVTSEVKKVKTEVAKLFKKEEFKKFLNNGLTITSDEDTFDYMEPRENDNGEEVYVSGDSFDIVRMDLWDYKEGNPRIIVNDTGTHPVYDAEGLLRKSLSEEIKNKFPNFDVDEYGGDWDTGSIDIILK